MLRKGYSGQRGDKLDPILDYLILKILKKANSNSFSRAQILDQLDNKIQDDYLDIFISNGMEAFPATLSVDQSGIITIY